MPTKPARFTPGPWGIEMSRSRLWVGPVRPNGEVVDNVCCFTFDDKHGPNFLARQGANARLIAAAPELLSAAESALFVLETLAVRMPVLQPGGEGQDILANLRSAIARATGESVK